MSAHEEAVAAIEDPKAALAGLRQLAEELRRVNYTKTAAKTEQIADSLAAALAQAQQDVYEYAIVANAREANENRYRERAERAEAALTQAQQERDAAEAEEQREREAAKHWHAQAQQMEEALRRIERLDDGRGSTIARMALFSVPQASELARMEEALTEIAQGSTHAWARRRARQGLGGWRRSPVPQAGEGTDQEPPHVYGRLRSP